MDEGSDMTGQGEPLDDDLGLNALEGFADRFVRDGRRPGCQLYLISPLDVGGGFPDRLARALDAGPVAAFQFRVKDVDQHEAARLAEPVQRVCADREVAFPKPPRRSSAPSLPGGYGSRRRARPRHLLAPNSLLLPGMRSQNTRLLRTCIATAAAQPNWNLA
jgi:thiamine-phosphate pyrophosphorylase